MPDNRKMSTAKKLVRAAALAAVLVPLGSVAVETSPITNLYSGGGGGSPINDQIFDFGPYEFRLFFENLAKFASFDVTVDNQTTNQAAVASRLTGFPGHVCVPLDPGVPSDPCVDFVVTAPSPGANKWTGFYDITIAWDADTDGTFPNSPGSRIRMLHNRGDVTGNGFDTDITIPGSYFSGFDPGIGGRDNNFQSFLVAQAPTAVPEPATLLLVSTGVSGLLHRRRRLRRNSDARSGS